MLSYCWLGVMGSNHQHTDSKSVVLPIELTPNITDQSWMGYAAKHFPPDWASANFIAVA